MAIEDYTEPEIAVAVAATAVVVSPKVRHYLRRGAVYGLAGILLAGDAVSEFAHSVAKGAQQAAAGVMSDQNGAAPASAENAPEGEPQ